MSRFLTIRVYVGGAPPRERVAAFVADRVAVALEKMPARSQEIGEEERMHCAVDLEMNDGRRLFGFGGPA